MLNATLVKRIDISPELLLLSIKPDEGVPDFHAGQYVAIGLPGSTPRIEGSLPEPEPTPPEKLLKRAYSIGSSPEEKEFLEFYVALVPDGALTPRLATLKVGDRLFVAHKITGTFTLEGIPANENLVLVATGTGLAPYLSMVRTPGTWTAGRSITIIHGVRFSKDFGYRDELLALEKSQPNFKYFPIVSRNDPSWNGHTGRIQKLFIDQVVPVDVSKDHIFLCGNPAMIEEMEVSLAASGYTVHSRKNPTGKLHVEKYW